MLQEFPILEQKTIDDEVFEVLEKLWKQVIHFKPLFLFLSLKRCITQKNNCQLELSEVYLRNQQLETIISNLKTTGSSLNKTIQSLQDVR